MNDKDSAIRAAVSGAADSRAATHAGGEENCGATEGKEVTEKWRPIPGYQGYWEVSDRDRVRGVGLFVCFPGWNSLAEFERARPMSPSEGHARDWILLPRGYEGWRRDEALRFHPHLDTLQ